MIQKVSSFLKKDTVLTIALALAVLSGALLSGLDALIEEKTGISTMIAEDPLTAVAIGTGKFIEFAHGEKKNYD